MALTRNRRDTGMLVVLYIASFVASYCNNLINVTLVSIMNEFSVSSSTAQWLVSGYCIVMVITVISMAFIYRRFSTRQIFFAAQGVFLLASFGCMFAPNFPVLLGVRLVQGIGVGLSIPLMMNTVMVLAPPESRGFAMGLGSTILTLAPAFAPAVSGMMISTFGWRSVFVPLIVISACILVAGIAVLRDANEREKASLDLPSALLLAIALAVFAFGLTRVMSDPLLGVGCLVAGALLFVAFTKRQQHAKSPFLELAPLKQLRFWPACALAMLGIMPSFSVNLLLPIYFEQGLTMSTFDIGFIMLVAAISNSLFGLFAGKLYDRFGSWPLIAIGFACIVGGQLIVLAFAHSFALTVVVAGGCLVCAGIGLSCAPVQVTGLSSLDAPMYPHGVSILTAFIQISGCIAPSLYIGVMNTVQANSAAAGAATSAATADGLGVAFIVAVAFSIVGLVLSVIYTRFIVKRYR